MLASFIISLSTDQVKISGRQIDQVRRVNKQVEARLTSLLTYLSVDPVRTVTEQVRGQSD